MNDDSIDVSIDVSSDKYFNDPDFLEGVNKTPVDINFGFVPENKNRDNLQKAQKNIRRRFNLGGE